MTLHSRVASRRPRLAAVLDNTQMALGVTDEILYSSSLKKRETLALDKPHFQI